MFYVCSSQLLRRVHPGREHIRLTCAVVRNVVRAGNFALGFAALVEAAPDVLPVALGRAL